MNPTPPTPPDRDSVPVSDSVPLGGTRYRLIARVAASAHGGLWVARAANGPEEGRIVCLRRIAWKPEDAALVQRIRGSTSVALKVRHPLLAAVLDVVVTDSDVAIVSEYVEGELLRSLARRAGLGNKPLDPAVVLRLVLDVARGAVAARDAWMAETDGAPALRGALHGWLGPDSVLVAAYGEPLLLDLGLAGILRTRPELHDHPESIPYDAPETLQSGVADERSDVFVLGTLLWELLANRPLFGSPKWTRFVGESSAPAAPEEATRARRRLFDMPIPRLDSVVRAGAAIPHDVADVVAAALERDPAARLPSLDAFVEAVCALGADRFATPTDVAAELEALAGATLAARRLALDAVTGSGSSPPSETDGARPTLLPGVTAQAPGERAEELASSPDALRTVEEKDKRPPPLPKRRLTR